MRRERLERPGWIDTERANLHGRAVGAVDAVETVGNDADLDQDRDPRTGDVVVTAVVTAVANVTVIAVVIETAVATVATVVAMPCVGIEFSLERSPR